MRLWNEFQFAFMIIFSGLWLLTWMFLLFHIGLAFFIWLIG